MAGARVVEEVLKRAPEMFKIVMFGAEPYGNYNRILLSNVLNQSQKPEEIFLNPLTWYRENGIFLYAGVKAVKIDTAHRCVVGYPLPADVNAYDFSDGLFDRDTVVTEPYDYIIIATGSRPFCPLDRRPGPTPGCFCSAPSTTAGVSPNSLMAAARSRSSEEACWGWRPRADY